MGLLLDFFVNLFANEIYSWLPSIARTLVRWNVSRLPVEIRERWEQEWLAEVEATPGHLWKLTYAADLFRAPKRLRFEARHSGVAYRPVTDVILQAWDFSASVTLTVGMAPMLLLIGCWLARQSSGHLLRRTPCFGRHGKPFDLLTFNVETDGSGLGRTGFGRWLLQTDVAELPIFLNVIRGEMSLVGPEPLIVGSSEADYWLQRSDLSVRQAVRPGISGPVQVCRPRPDYLQKAEIDLRWVAQRSYWRMLAVVWLTFVRGISK